MQTRSNRLPLVLLLLLSGGLLIACGGSAPASPTAVAAAATATSAPSSTSAPINTVSPSKTVKPSSTPKPTSTPRGSATSAPATGSVVVDAVMAQDTLPPELAPLGVTDTFPPNFSKFHAVVTIKNAPSNTKFKATWLVVNASEAGPPGKNLGSYDLTADGDGYLDFTYSPFGGKMPIGSYKVEIAVNGKLARTVNFSVSTNAVLPPLATPTSGAGTSALGDVLFEDDFSDPGSGWNTADLGFAKFGYNFGEYRINITQGNVNSYALLPNHTFNDVSLETDATLYAGPTSSVFGLLCRGAATEGGPLTKGYEFVITPNGNYGVIKVSGSGAGQSKVLGQEGTSSAINKGNFANHLRADCSAGNLAFYVNGQQLIAVQDSDFQDGQVGFAVSSPDGSPGYEVGFDNFVVRQAGQRGNTGCVTPPSNDQYPGFQIGTTMAKRTQGATKDPVDAGRIFGTRDVFHAVVNIVDAPKNTRFKAVWYVDDSGGLNPCNYKWDETELTSDGTRNLEFTLTPATTWPVGSYRVEIYVNDVVALTTTFTVQ